MHASGTPLHPDAIYPGLHFVGGKWPEKAMGPDLGDIWEISATRQPGSIETTLL